MKQLALISVVFLLSGFGGSAQAATAPNFVLLDQNGMAHELHYHKAKQSIVLVTHSLNCAANAQITSSVNEYVNTHPDVAVFLLNADIKDDRAALRAYAEKSGLTAPILQDESQLISASLQASSAGNAIVIDPKTWQITHHDSAAAFFNHQNEVNVGDCKINFQHRSSSNVDYATQVAPLLQEKCVVCHTEGGLGPWAMNSHLMVQGFAPMIREVLLTKRMPPWHADPHIGVWKNDISLSNQQLQTLVQWIDEGAKRGQGVDPLAQQNTVSAEWPLGEPDLIIDIPKHTVPASGVVDYQFPTVPNPLDHGVWIKAATVVPGDREVVHHILAGTLDSDTTDLRRNSGVFDNYLIGYAPGNESHKFPQDTGVFIPAGGEFLFQLHYTPVGRETVDESRIGLYFHEQPPENFYRQEVVVDPTIRIPPNEARHAETAYYKFPKEAWLHDLVPHAHYRGVASKFELIKPDGSTEVVLSVPNYDFNWQRTYEFVEPKRIPAGSRLVHTTWYDNSASNPGNPNPEREVPWGLQSWDEMLYGAFSYTYVNETVESPIYDRTLAQTTQWVGFLDQNMDGKLSWRELPKQVKKQLVQGFKAVDSNGDGGLDIDEMYVIVEKLAERRAKERAEKQSTQTDAR